MTTIPLPSREGELLAARLVPNWNQVPVPRRVARRAYYRWLPGPGDCWPSAYSRQSQGYAQIGWVDGDGRHVVLAHRAAWVYVNGQVPGGVTLDHMCKTRYCVNPAHLRALPNYENARRTFGRDWELGVCANGHPSDRLRVEPSGRIRCADCKALYGRRYRAKKRRGAI